ncbi:hypothetical protein BDV29DRAFT_164476 [Aspergillus leporis]|uniref:Uncharacterized protein n=1 Tax=Aspergillus leporis TaxID=41062 RepID=A0A5N5XFH4_9EURO|nr:hypothetical protein BDV29DRAFT_164476 [Aspergillus leporis]
MCASATRWAGFKKYVCGTSIDTPVKKNWGEIHISSKEVFEASFNLPSRTHLLGDVLANEADPYFFDSSMRLILVLGDVRRLGMGRGAGRPRR